MQNIWMVVPKYKWAYCGIPKAANSSVKEAVIRAMGFSFEGKVPQYHKSFKRIPASHVPKDYLKFVIVRNPFDRLVSFYVDKICTQKCASQGFEKIGFRENMPFFEAIALVQANPRANVHFQPQVELIGMSIYRLNWIGHFEDISTSWNKIRELTKMHCDWNLPSKLTHRNKSDRDNWPTYYDPELMKRVYNIYLEDFVAFGY